MRRHVGKSVYLATLALVAACGSDPTEPTFRPPSARPATNATAVVSADVSDGQGTAWRQRMPALGAHTCGAPMRFAEARRSAAASGAGTCA